MPTRGDLVQEMRTYLAECTAHGFDEGDLRDLHCALERTSARVSTADRSVVYLHSTYLPDVERWTAVFMADAPDLVRRVTDIAQLSSVEIHRALALVVARDVHAGTAGHGATSERNS
jgi:hypothetical protein